MVTLIACQYGDWLGSRPDLPVRSGYSTLLLYSYILCTCSWDIHHMHCALKRVEHTYVRTWVLSCTGSSQYREILNGPEVLPLGDYKF